MSVSIQSITGGAGGSGAPTTSQYVTLATDATLTNERVLTAGGGIALTDAGAGGAVTLRSHFKLIGVNRTPVTVDAGGAAGSTETDLQTLTLGTNEIDQDQVLVLRLRGTITWTGSPNLTIKAYFGSTVIWTGTWTSGSSDTNVAVKAEVELVPSATFGAAVACEADGIGFFGRDNAASGVVFGDGKTGTVNVATNGATPTVKFTAKWSSATAGNSIVGRLFFAERKG